MLRRLGYHTTLTSNLDTANLVGSGWNADYPTAFNFINWACQGFCDRYPHLTRLITDARHRQVHDPAVAGQLWAQVDQAILHLGPPWIPLINPLAIGFVSSRVGNYQFSAAAGDDPLIDQMWVR